MNEVKNYEREGGSCPKCGTRAEFRVCSQCGVAAWVIDCGHYGQPRPIAAGPDGLLYCDDCWEEKL